MKHCPCCEERIPDHARRCPHCRDLQPQGGWVFQAVLVALVVGAAVAWALGMR